MQIKNNIAGLFILILFNSCVSNRVDVNNNCQSCIAINDENKQINNATCISVKNENCNKIISKAIENSPNLHCLKINGFDISFPSKINSISNDNLNLDSLIIKKLNNIKNIEIAGVNLSKFPMNLFNLQNIEYLSLECCLINSVPNQISGFKNLKELRLRLNNIGQLPMDLNKLENLEAIDLGNNLLTEIPPVLFELKKLKIVSFANPEFKSEIFALSNFPTNEINYLKNIDSLIKLLTLSNIEKVYINVKESTTKRELLNILKRQKLNKKIFFI